MIIDQQDKTGPLLPRYKNTKVKEILKLIPLESMIKTRSDDLAVKDPTQSIDPESDVNEHNILQPPEEFPNDCRPNIINEQVSSNQSYRPKSILLIQHHKDYANQI
jgi:hypothetical protein